MLVCLCVVASEKKWILDRDGGCVGVGHGGERTETAAIITTRERKRKKKGIV